MRHIFIRGLPYSAIFFNTSFKRHDFRNEVKEHKTCDLIFSTNLSLTFLVISRIQRDTIINIQRSPCKKTGYACQILIKLEISVQIFEKKILKYQISRRSVQWEPSCSRRTDVQKLIVAFGSFSNVPKTAIIALYIFNT